jgi:hypothetical protein
MSIESMENIKKDRPKELKLELELPVDKKEPIKRDPRVGFNSDGLFDPNDPKFKDKETFEERAKKAVQEVATSIGIEEIENKDKSFLKQSNEDHERMEREARLEKQGDLLDIERQIGIIEEAIEKNEDSYIVEDAKKRLPILKKKYNELLEQVLEDTKKSLNK